MRNVQLRRKEQEWQTTQRIHMSTALPPSTTTMLQSLYSTTNPVMNSCLQLVSILKRWARLLKSRTLPTDSEHDCNLIVRQQSPRWTIRGQSPRISHHYHTRPSLTLSQRWSLSNSMSSHQSPTGTGMRLCRDSRHATVNGIFPASWRYVSTLPVYRWFLQHKRCLS